MDNRYPKLLITISLLCVMGKQSRKKIGSNTSYVEASHCISIHWGQKYLLSFVSHIQQRTNLRLPLWKHLVSKRIWSVFIQLTFQNEFICSRNMKYLKDKKKRTMKQVLPKTATNSFWNASDIAFFIGSFWVVFLFIRNDNGPKSKQNKWT